MCTPSSWGARSPALRRSSPMTAASNNSGALAGLRVLDLSRVLAGPWSGQLLADLGADVVKIERPEGGDDTRSWGPPWLRDVEGQETSEAAYYLCANRNKRSVTADLNHPDGRRIVPAGVFRRNLSRAIRRTAVGADSGTISRALRR